MNHRQFRHAHLLLLLLLAHTLALALSSHLPPPTSRVFIPPTPSPIEPYPWLHGGSFTSPPITYHPDPLATYEWQPSVNASQLQVRSSRLDILHPGAPISSFKIGIVTICSQLFCLLPLSVSLTSDTEASSILNAQSLLAQASNVTFTGQGAIELDFGKASYQRPISSNHRAPAPLAFIHNTSHCFNKGVNSAAWIEFDSPDLAPTDAANLLVLISEYNKCELKWVLKLDNFGG